MNMLDYQVGLSQGVSERNAAVRRSNNTIAAWKDYSADLERQLTEAQKKSAMHKAYLDARDAQQRALRTALQERDPSHPLLKELKKIADTAMAESFAKNGYHYDPAAEVLRKI